MPNKKDGERSQLLFLAKRLADVAKDIDILKEDKKKVVVERAEWQNEKGLIELYNALGEYMG